MKPYKEQISGLVEGDADILKIEITTDTLNPKDATYANNEYFDVTCNERLAVMLSFKIVDNNGNISMDQTAEALYVIVRKEPNASRWCTEIQNEYIRINTDATSATMKPNTGVVVNYVPDSMNMNKKVLQKNLGAPGSTPSSAGAKS